MSDPHRPLKVAFGRYATGVAVVAAWRSDGEIAAITVNSFTSVSLEPPLVLWCLERKASTYDIFSAARGYGVSVLRAEQQDLSNRFAMRGDAPAPRELFTRINDGAPLLADRLAGFDCAVVDRHPAGDHDILIAKVVHFDADAGSPLLYFASNYAQGPGTE